ncbi:hypothetical protein CRM22_007039 [Opisthorchis felineus]|uniref:Cadherin domain-containing protein n=1 Tax=Opisthorchis felineus TaxID=147828 RepID=A0A4S2LJX1_OPIFE|nr:hypothetical protein CRM22_007039 [Opisthorchis felineus]
MHQNNRNTHFLHHLFLLNLLGSLHGRNIQFTINEELPPGTQIGSLLDHVPGSYSNLKFVKLSHTHDTSRLFSVDQFTGAITVASRLDREVLCQEKSLMLLPASSNTPFDNKLWEFNITKPGTCQVHFGVNCLSVRASTALNGRLSGKLIVLFDVTVNIRDLNDNVCTFVPSDKQVITLDEDAPVGETRIPLHIPYDPDDVSMGHSVSLNSIRLHPTSSPEYPSQTVVNESPLTIVTEQTFRINIFNGNSPDFMTNIPFDSNHSFPFRIELELLKPLDFEKRKNYTFYVKADDGSTGAEHECNLNLIVQVLDCNDNPPVFEKNFYSANITEDTPIGILILQVKATDADSGPNGAVQYRIEGANFRALRSFKLHPETGELRLNDRLNYRDQSTYSFNIVAENINTNYSLRDRNRKHNAVTRVQVHVTDVNDQAPDIHIFSPTGLPTLEVVEETSPGQDIAIVDVTDGDSGQNAVVDCRLINQTIPDALKLTFMDESVVQNAKSYNKKRYKITVEKSLDRESSKALHFTIHCWDQGTPSLVADMPSTLNLIDINDNLPLFRKNVYSVMVTEDSDPLRLKNRFEIVKVEATDRDDGQNAQLRYSLDHGTPTALLGLVKIDAESGVLSSTGSLDRERLDAFSVTVIATDLGDPPRSAHTVVNIRILDYNDNPPTFLKSSYSFSVRENCPVGELIGTLTLTDDDIGNNARIKFELDDVADRASAFSRPLILHKGTIDYGSPINPYSVVHSDSRETNHNKELTQVRLVSYQVRSPPSMLKQLQNSTIYEVQLYTNSIWDRESNMPHSKAIATGEFRAIQMGEVGLAGELGQMNYSLDRDSYVVIQIQAEDQGTPRLVRRVTVRILIEDENDNSPIMLFPDPNTLNVTRIPVSYKEPKGYTFAQIYAIDLDAGENGTVRYHINSGNTAKFFKLDQFTGALQFTRELSLQALGDYSLEVEARDCGQPSKSSFSQLIVGVEDIAPKGLVDHNLYSLSGLVDAGSTGHRFNMYILIAIVAASTVVSILLLSSICFVLRRSRRSTTCRNPHSTTNASINGVEKTQLHLNSTGAKYTTAFPMSSSYTATPSVDEQPQFYAAQKLVVMTCINPIQ